MTKSHFSYIAIMHKAMWFRLEKGQVECQGPWASCYVQNCNALRLFGVTRSLVLFAHRVMKEYIYNKQGMYIHLYFRR